MSPVVNDRNSTSTYAYDPIENCATSTLAGPNLVTTACARDAPNQCDRTSMGAGEPLQRFTYDADGNLTETYVVADMNCDGHVDNFDNNPFTLALTSRTAYETAWPNCNYLNGDLNGDGLLNNFDINLFSTYLTGHGSGTELRVAYTWDAENRLAAVEPATSPAEGDQKAEYRYDYLGRRIEKKVYTYDEDWVLTEHRRFVWGGTGTGGWLLLLELDGLHSNAVVRKYTWGLDRGGVRRWESRAGGNGRRKAFVRRVRSCAPVGVGDGRQGVA